LFATHDWAKVQGEDISRCFFHFILEGSKVIREVKYLLRWKTMLRAILLECAEKFVIA